MVRPKIETFGERVRRIREGRTIPQTQLAQALGISGAYLSRIESGRDHPPAEAVIRLMASALGESADALLAHAGRVPEDIAAWLVADPSRLATLRKRMAREVKS